jgi:ethanolamine ammonia-lyase small subunit
MSSTDVEAIVAAVLAELQRVGLGGGEDAPRVAGDGATGAGGAGAAVIDLPDPTEPQQRRRSGVDHPHDAEGLANLMAATNARLGVGRAGPRPRTGALLLFQADHGVAQDAIYGVVEEPVLEQFGLFRTRTQVADREEYLLRPDLGRRLSEDSRRLVAERCTRDPDVQIVVGDGLSAHAINHNLAQIYPVIEQGLTDARLTLGTPFFIENARVGVINDVGEVTGAKSVLILIGERPGLGIADAMSAYMGYEPRPGKTDADRDLICMITANGGTNPLEAGAYVVELLKRMLDHQASGVELRRKTAGRD